jgi:hypothetical protein
MPFLQRGRGMKGIDSNTVDEVTLKLSGLIGVFDLYG